MSPKQKTGGNAENLCSALERIHERGNMNAHDQEIHGRAPSVSLNLHIAPEGL